MRTKTLLLTAVLSAAGAASSFAQGAVYSQNAVGYVNVSLDPGFNLICNPLKNTAGNQLSKILTLTDADIGTTVYWYDTTTKGFKNSTFLGAAVGWTPDQPIDPGVGIFINVSAAKTVTFVGDVPQGTDSNISLSSGFSLISSPVPQSADLAAMQFPADVGDTVYFYRGTATAKSYVASTFLGAAGWLPAAVPLVGEGFWSSKAAAGTWTRNFSVNTP